MLPVARTSRLSTWHYDATWEVQFPSKKSWVLKLGILPHSRRIKTRSDGGIEEAVYKNPLQIRPRAKRDLSSPNLFPMAESDAKSDETLQKGEEKKEEGLKYLDFVQVAAVQAVACLCSFYEFAKENSGPLKSGVQTVEGTVKAVIGPVYEKLHDVPFELLKFVDRKVGDSVKEAEKYVPAVVKQASTAARSVADEVHRSGVTAAAAGYGRSAYEQVEPVAERWAVIAWRSANRLPLFPQVADLVVPTAAHLAERYNRAVGSAAEQGYEVAAYIPLVPVERIAKLFGSDAREEPASDEAASHEVEIEGDAAE